MMRRSQSFLLCFFAIWSASFLVQSISGAEPANTQDLHFAEAKPVKQSAYAFNSNLLMVTALHGISYGSGEFGKAIGELRPGGLRFPGGTTANNYLWKEDSFSLQRDDKTKWAAQQLEIFRKIGRKYDLPGYAKLCNETGMTPIWVLNVYEETPESVLALFDRLDELSLVVRAIEMGNEPYWDPRSLMNVWKYSEYCRPLAATIREHRPDVAIGACFGPVREDASYAEKWNAPLAKQDWYDAVVYHEYYGGQGFALEAGVELPVEAMLHPEALFDEAFDHLEELVPGKPIWFTEWNMGQKGLKQWKNRGAELLFLGASMVRLLEYREKIEWSCFHQIYESNFGTFSFDKGTGIYTLPSYEFFRLFGSTLEDAGELQMLEGEANDPVRGFSAMGAKGIRVFLLNRSEADISVSLPEGAGMAGLTMRAKPEKELPLSRSITSPLSIVESMATLPAHSISLIASEEVLAKASRKDENVSGNLLPVRPHLTLWYPPYARKQPRVSAEGSYEVDFSAFADKPSAMVKMDLSGFSPQEGMQYRVSFEANAKPGIGFVAKLPQAGSDDGVWMQLTPQFEKQRLEFVYSAGDNNGEVSFFFTEKAITASPKLTLRNFSVVEIESP